MTRFEILRYFATDGKAKTRHIALFHVLSELWVSANRPEPFEPDTDEVARFLAIGYSTAMRWLNELEQFGYIELRRGCNQHEKTTLVFKVGYASTGTAVRQLRRHDTNRESEGMPDLRQHDVKRDGSASTERAGIEGFTVKSPIPGSEGHTVDKPVSAQPLLMHNNNHLIDERSSINSSGKDDDVKGVQGKKQNRRADGLKKPPNRPVCKFADSPLADLTRFQEAFASETTYRYADLTHYYERLLNWRDKAGNAPERADWLATAKTFLLNDYREGKLVTVNTHLKPINHANPRNPSRSAVIEPESTTGRRFGNW